MKLRQAVQVATLVGAVAGAALVATPQASAANLTVPVHTMTLPVPARVTTKPDIVPTAVSDNCSAALTHLTDYAARGITQVACESTTLTPARTTSVTPNAFPAACANNEWVVVRTEECNLNSVHEWLVHDAKTGALIGTETYLISQDIRLSTTSGTITESITFGYSTATGAAAGLPATVSWTSGCGAPCGITTVPTLTFGVPFGGSRTFTVSYRDNPSAAAPDTFSTSYNYIVNLPNIVPINSDRWTSPLPIRCDNNTPGFTNPGCVVPAYPPNLILPLSKYGAAAANALVGETNLPGTPGLSAQTPLTRGDPAQTDANRGITCGGFQPLAPGNSYGVVSDSCDEYPFASSQQSGGALKIAGSNCLEIVPKQDATGKWTAINLNTYTGAYPQVCLRGHVNSILNSQVGSRELNPLYTLNRMMIGDKYTVSVTQ